MLFAKNTDATKAKLEFAGLSGQFRTGNAGLSEFVVFSPSGFASSRV
jgi:hypothetical protein